MYVYINCKMTTRVTFLTKSKVDLWENQNKHVHVCTIFCWSDKHTHVQVESFIRDHQQMILKELLQTGSHQNKRICENEEREVCCSSNNLRYCTCPIFQNLGNPHFHTTCTCVCVSMAKEQRLVGTPKKSGRLNYWYQFH